MSQQYIVVAADNRSPADATEGVWHNGLDYTADMFRQTSPIVLR